MSYLYRSRHSQRGSGLPKLPVAAASAVLALGAGLGVSTLHHYPSPADAQTPAAAAESVAPRQTAAAASRDRRPGQAASDSAAPSSTSAARSSTSAAPSSTSAAPSSTGAAPSPTTAAAVPAQLDLKYQFAWQENYYFCGPAATRIALTARGMYPSQSEVAQALGTTVNGTNSSDDTTRALNQYTASGFYTAHFIRGQAATDADVAALKQAVLNAVGKGYAVVANIAGSTVDDSGHGHSYPGGHYLTIVGYRDGGDTVKIADPADATGVGSYTLSTRKMADWIALRGYAA